MSSLSNLSRFKQDRNRLLLWVLAILLFGFALIATLSYVLSRHSVRQTLSNESLPLTSDNVYSELQRDLIGPIALSAQMANNAFLRDWLIEGEKETALVTRYLEQVKAKFGASTSFLVSNNSLNYYNHGGLYKQVKPDYPRDQWYFRVRAQKEPYELNIDTDRANAGALTVFVNHQLYDYQGVFLGVTGIGHKTTTLRDAIALIEKKFSRRIYFVNNDGKIMLAGPTLKPTVQTLDNIDGIQAIRDDIMSRDPTPRALHYLRDEQHIQVNTRYVQELKWRLVVEQEEALALAPFRRALYLSLLMGALCTSAVLGLMWIAVRGYQRRVEHAATYDALTDVINRQSGDALVASRISSINSGKWKEPLSVILFDIDHFKLVNDGFGHLAGDSTLKKVAALAQQHARTTFGERVRIIRWGGDEFFLVLDGVALEATQNFASDLCAMVSQELNHADGPTVSISAGVTDHAPGESEHDLFARADAALYKAKAQGRNCAIAFPSWQTAGAGAHSGSSAAAPPSA